MNDENDFIWKAIFLFFSTSLGMYIGIANQASEIFSIGDFFYIILIKDYPLYISRLISTFLYSIAIIINILFLGYMWKTSYLDRWNNFYKKFLFGIFGIAFTPIYIYYFMLFIFEKYLKYIK
jgi:hypothetical protein